LDALLIRLTKDSINAPQHLLKFKESPRVLKALTEAYKQFPLDELSNIPWAINFIGAENTEKILLLRFEDFLNDQGTFLDDEFCNPKAYNLSAITIDILSRNPSNLQAFNVFVKLLDHPCLLNRQNNAATFLSRAGAFAGTEVLAKMHQEIIEKNIALPIPEINDALPDSKIFNALLYKRVHTTVRRLRELLFSDEKYWWAEQVLWQLPLSYQKQAREVLLEYLLNGKTTLAQTEYFCTRLGKTVPKGFLANSLASEKETIKEWLDDHSPSKRLDAIQLFDHLESGLARELASYALQDEPDPALQKKLKTYL
jgi:hypothetical protein